MVVFSKGLLTVCGLLSNRNGVGVRPTPIFPSTFIHPPVFSSSTPGYVRARRRRGVILESRSIESARALDEVYGPRWADLRDADPWEPKRIYGSQGPREISRAQASIRQHV